MDRVDIDQAGGRLIRLLVEARDDGYPIQQSANTSVLIRIVDRTQSVDAQFAMPTYRYRLAKN